MSSATARLLLASYDWEGCRICFDKRNQPHFSGLTLVCKNSRLLKMESSTTAVNYFALSKKLPHLIGINLTSQFEILEKKKA